MEFGNVYLNVECIVYHLFAVIYAIFMPFRFRRFFAPALLFFIRFYHARTGDIFGSPMAVVVAVARAARSRRLIMWNRFVFLFLFLSRRRRQRAENYLFGLERWTSGAHQHLHTHADLIFAYLRVGTNLRHFGCRGAKLQNIKKIFTKKLIFFNFSLKLFLICLKIQKYCLLLNNEVDYDGPDFKTFAERGMHS